MVRVNFNHNGTNITNRLKKQGRANWCKFSSQSYVPHKVNTRRLSPFINFILFIMRVNDECANSTMEKLVKSSKKNLRKLIDSYMLMEPCPISRRSAYEGFQLMMDAIERIGEINQEQKGVIV